MEQIKQTEISEQEWIDGFRRQQKRNKEIITPEEVLIFMAYSEKVRKFPQSITPEH